MTSRRVIFGLCACATLTCVALLSAQEVTGKVTDAKSALPLRSALVTVDDATKGVRTGDNGTFYLPKLAVGRHVLNVRLTGYVRKTVPVTVTDGDLVSVDVALDSRVTLLNQVVAGFGGAHWEFARIAADVSVRRDNSRNVSQFVASEQPFFNRIVTGAIFVGGSVPPSPSTNEGVDQAFGVTSTVTLVPWWSQTFTVGKDASEYRKLNDPPAFTNWTDSLSALNVAGGDNLTISYSTTAQGQIGAIAHGIVTAGYDGWNQSRFITAVNGTDFKSFAGNGFVYLSRTHNRGGFVQGQLGLWDALFFTYGVRAEWNPNLGADATMG